MKKYKFTVTLIALLTFCTTMFMPVASVNAASISDLLGQTTKSDNNSGSDNLLNIIIGLLLGKFLDKFVKSTPTNSSSNPVLGAAIGPNDSNSVTNKQNNIINTAKSYLGTPYVFGGNTPDGWDCSAFTKYVMSKNGVTLPRTAAEQFTVGTAVNKSNLRIADLVFFETYKPGASHVGFYMGNGKFIHASSAAGQVTISNLNDPYYEQHYIGARRIIQ